MTKDRENIHSEPGRFWIISDGMDLGALASMDGLLTIRDDGQTEIEILPQAWAWAISLENIIAGQHINIGGQLHRSEQTIKLTGAWLQAISPVKLRSFTSLVVPGEPASLRQERLIETLTIPLENVWPWLGRSMPVGNHVDDYYELKYQLLNDKSFALPNTTITISSSYGFNFDMSLRTATVKPRAQIQFNFESPVTLGEAQAMYLDFEDLLVLLTNQECGLDWPKVAISGTEGVGFLYCSRRRKIGGAISHLNCWLPYPDVENVFGNILGKWLTKRTEYGAAFHLYLGTRRGDQLYAEHRFMNLMWGLEALHRIHWPAPPENLERNARVESINQALKSIANSDERRVIRKALQQEIRLEDRLLEMFSSLPINIPSKSLKEFSKQCADRRNDVSHHGGPRDGSNYGSFPLKLHELSSALSPLYHALILAAIDVPNETIRDIFLKSHKSFRELAYFKRSGLEVVDNT